MVVFVWCCICVVVYWCVCNIGCRVCMCDCVVFDFFFFLSLMLVLLHFMRNKLNIIEINVISFFAEMLVNTRLTWHVQTHLEADQTAEYSGQISDDGSQEANERERYAERKPAVENARWWNKCEQQLYRQPTNQPTDQSHILLTLFFQALAFLISGIHLDPEDISSPCRY